jgi:hypothetical protein
MLLPDENRCHGPTWVGCNCTGEVVCLSCEQQVPVPGLGCQGRRASRVEGQQRVDLEATDGTAVVLECNHAVVVGADLHTAERGRQITGCRNMSEPVNCNHLGWDMACTGV